MKAALYHMAHPNEDILYTYYTKSLFGLIKNLIERFYRDFADNREPNWKKIHILHGWGGVELGGVYSTACMEMVLSLLHTISLGSSLQIHLIMFANPFWELVR